MDFIKKLFDKIFGRQNTPEQTAPTNTLEARDITAENLVVGTQIINQYLQGGGKQRDAKAIERALIEYLESLKSQYADLRLSALFDAANPLDLVPLSAAYVGTTVLPDGWAGTPDAADAEARLRNLGGSVPFERVLLFNQHVVVTADEGQGKSVSLLRLAHLLAQGILSDTARDADDLALSRPLPVPFYLPLNLYAQQVQSLAGETTLIRQSLPAFLDQYLKDNSFGLPDDFFSVLVEADRPVVLLLDALDEIVDEGWRNGIAEHLRTISSSKRNVHFVVTCRPSAHAKRPLGERFLPFAIQPFDEARLKAVVEGAYVAKYGETMSGIREATRRAESLLKGIREIEQRRAEQLGAGQPRLIDSPLMAHLALIVHDATGSLPVYRAELLMQATDLLLNAVYDPQPAAGQDVARHVAGDWTIHRAILQRVAFTLQQANLTEVSEADLDRIIGQDADQRPFAGDVKEFARARGGVLIAQARRYGFRHVALQQSLAACHLCATQSPTDAATWLAAGNRLATDWWREVAYLAAGYYVAQNSPDRDEAKLAAFLSELANWGAQAHTDPAARFACVEVAAQAARDLLPNHATARTAIAMRMAEVFEDVPAMTTATPRQRMQLGNVLGTFGDPRQHVMDVDAMHLCVVPAGRFMMGSDASDPDAVHSERCADADFNQNGVDIPCAYAIGQHPITYTQFNQFMKEGGYEDKRWWDVAIRAGVWKAGELTVRGLTRDFGDAPRTSEAFNALKDAGALKEDTITARRPYEFDDRLAATPNHPVVLLSWYEALAFCAWLEQRWRAKGWLSPNQHVTLPSEPEWEKAGRGGVRIPAQASIIAPQTLPSWAEDGEATAGVSDNPFPRRRFPWGDAVDANKANWRETGLGEACAVGSFPLGAGPYGGHDLSGNTWDWTRSLYGYRASLLDSARMDYPYPYGVGDARREALVADTRTARVLRGGSWHNSLRNARCAVRSNNTPDDWNVDNNGFRVVVSPVSSGSGSGR